MDEISELQKELIAAFELVNVESCEIQNKHGIIKKIQNQFVSGTPRAWWTHLLPPVKVHKFEDNTAYLHLMEIAPSKFPNIWFVVDEDNERMLLYKVPLEKIKDVIKECRFFEYYIVAEDFSWLLAENDHGDLLLCQNLDNHLP
jgi:hypothetical protein